MNVAVTEHTRVNRCTCRELGGEQGRRGGGSDSLPVLGGKLSVHLTVTKLKSGKWILFISVLTALQR